MLQRSKYLWIEDGHYVDSSEPVSSVLLVRQEDGRTFKLASGDDLTALSELRPHFFRTQYHSEDDPSATLANEEQLYCRAHNNHRHPPAASAPNDYFEELPMCLLRPNKQV